MKYITRIAPSPTGDMHLGTARTALFNYLAARGSGGSFICRIDDTDLDRNQERCVDIVYDTLKWLGLNYDETFRQSQRADLYKAQAYSLLAQGKALLLDNGAIALKWPENMPDFWQDEIAGQIKITQTNKDQIDGRLILLRGGDKGGQATYQFASILDDYFSSVNYIIRGVDHITNTPKQLAIWRAITEQPFPKCAHVGLIFKDKKKMSKRDGAASMLYYKDNGYSPDALFNFMLKMGWGPNTGRGPEQKTIEKEFEFVTREKAIESFLTRGTMKASNANFDTGKLEAFQRKCKNV